MIKSKKFLVRVGDSVQKAYDEFTYEQERAWSKYQEASDRSRNYLTSLLPKGYKANPYASCLERHNDSLVDGYLVLNGIIESEK